MALDDVVSPEVGVAVAATAVIMSPQARNVARKGLVYGLAGLIKLGDAASSAARGVGQNVQEMATSAGQTAQGVTNEARAQAAGEPFEPLNEDQPAEKAAPRAGRTQRAKP